MNNEIVEVGETAKSIGIAQLVTFTVNNEEYAVEVLRVREIIRMTTITQMPNTSEYVEGIINLRGKVIPVVSMRKRFGMMESGNDSHTRIIIMDVHGELMGFVVDSVSEVFRVSGSEIQPPPALVSGDISQECIAGVINHGDRLLVLLDLDKMLSQEEKQLLGSV